MVYWRDIPSDAHYTSPFYNPNEEEKFLLWDVDPAGLNNKRLSFENFVLLAHAMGRTLVMPPKGVWWGFSSMNNGTKFQMNKNKPRHDGPWRISMTLTKWQPNRMADRSKGRALFPPDNKTDWGDVMQ